VQQFRSSNLGRSVRVRYFTSKFVLCMDKNFPINVQLYGDTKVEKSGGVGFEVHRTKINANSL